MGPCDWELYQSTLRGRDPTISRPVLEVQACPIHFVSQGTLACGLVNLPRNAVTLGRKRGE